MCFLRALYFFFLSFVYVGVSVSVVCCVMHVRVCVLRG